MSSSNSIIKAIQGPFHQGNKQFRESAGKLAVSVLVALCTCFL